MKIVILSGAGLSAESGINTFRDKGGLWENYSTDEIATLEGFSENPEVVHRFYNERRRQLLTVEPNAAHYALAELEHKPGIELYHVTQNVDNLCERAGSKNVIHMHGELLKCRCLMCGSVVSWYEDTDTSLECPECGTTTEWGALRPHIVWFGEIPMYMNEIEKAVRHCDIFAAIGTSGLVYPAAGLVEKAKIAGAKTLLLNKEITMENYHFFDKVITGNATEVVPTWINSLF